MDKKLTAMDTLKLKNEIQNIEFHDLGIQKLNLDFSTDKVEIVFDEFDDLEKTYKPLALNFTGISKIYLDYPQNEVDFSLESLLEANFNLENNKPFVEFIFSMGFAMPSCSLTIGFTSLTVKRTLSDKAIEFKKANLETRYEKIEWFEKNNLALPEWV
jgi:hypothetical protein